jgi:hypothetical protein
MKKILMILMGCMLISGCSSTSSSPKETKETQETSVKAKEKKKETHSKNEEAFITNKEGEKIYSLTIDSVKEVKVLQEDEEFLPNNSAQTVVITYTYKFLQEDPENLETLSIEPLDLNMFDETNLSGDLVGLGTGYFPFDGESPEIMADRSAQSHYVYSLKNISNNVTIDFASELYGQSLTFKVPVEKQ